MGGAHIMAICQVAPNDTGKQKLIPLRFGFNMSKGWLELVSGMDLFGGRSTSNSCFCQCPQNAGQGQVVRYWACGFAALTVPQWWNRFSKNEHMSGINASICSLDFDISSVNFGGSWPNAIVKQPGI